MLTLAVAAPPASAQWIVYDPTNFGQNVLTAARELQQINNQITMLTNQATSLVNQARNLANLPMSTLTQLQSSIAQTQSLLRSGAEHRLQRPAHRAGLFDELRFGRRHRFDHRHGRQRADPLAELRRRLRGQPEGTGGRGRQHPDELQCDDLASHGQPERDRRAAGGTGRQPTLGAAIQQLSDLVAVLSAKSRADALEQARTASAEAQGQQNYKTFSTRTGYQPGNVTMFSGN